MRITTEVPGTLADLVRAAADARPDATALRSGEEAVTFGGLRERVQATARRLHHHAPPADGTAALLFENTPECAVAFLAAACTGMRLVPLEPDTGEARLRALRRELGPLTVIGHQAKLRALRLPGAASADGRQGDGLVPVEEPPGGTPARPDDAPLPAAGPDAPFLYQYTSGSTGEPKAAVHSQRDLVHGGEIYAHTYGITAADRILAAVPLLHSFGMVAGLVTALRTGAQLVLPGRFVPAKLLRTVREHACTVLVTTPLACDLLARSAAADRGQPPLPGSLRLCLSSGAALPAPVAARFREHCGLGVQQVYGSTEAGIIAAQRPEDEGVDRGVGRPVRGVRIRLVDERGRALPPGATGSLLVRTPAMFTHYLDRPGPTRQAFRDGWYATGDLARTDREGRLHLVGRKDSFINVGGKKVNPTEVEEVLLAHPAVAEAVVWGDRGEQGEQGGITDGVSERVRATVVARAPLSAADLAAHCRGRLLPHQVPGGVEFVASLPKSPLGKVRRAAVVDAAARRETASRREAAGESADG
ncbi:class I adenylate-forming enzyme family protein [Streptomyces netropsis]|uniref:class I adenylate-forming enzyme family protein n=1 Tax=Streptomyces netropsis TaxID=55404 RepID=UPI0030D32D1F